MPRGIGMLTSLQTLSAFVVDKDGSHGGADLSELSGLNNLRGQLKIKNLGFVKNAKEMFRAVNLKAKQHLRSLVLVWSGDGDNDDKPLEDLQPNPNLEPLLVIGWRGDAKFPSWISLLTSLVNISIWGPTKFKHLPSFAQLPCLQHLFILDLVEVEYMDSNNPNGRQGDLESFFPLLKCLHIQNCPNMKGWWRKRPIDDDNEDDTTVIGTSTMAFPCLSYLHIEDCPLTSMPLYPSLDELKLVKTSSRPLKQTLQMNITKISRSSSTPSLPLSKLNSFHGENIKELDTRILDECLRHLIGLESLTIRDCKELDLHDMEWEPLKNLSCLVIDNIPQLVFLPFGLRHLFQLKTLEIRYCSGLRSLFPVFQYLTSLEEFSIRNCNELELSEAGIQIFRDYTSLHALWLENIPKCQHFPEWLQHLTNLQQLYLIHLPNLTLLPGKMRSLTSLEELCIQQTPRLEERCRKDIGADWHKIAHIATVTIEDF
ncbi:disease resistance protein RGA2-like [Gossypium australe]|uniref:Disease resistance protein RGA2-like n=1 Tax=Gossypium australe TaxID=47621 RepID=A0A5B6VS85_9ROSI|nr:disease resistance protein RGA2-like [Gossypium australe]